MAAEDTILAYLQGKYDHMSMFQNKRKETTLEIYQKSLKILQEEKENLLEDISVVLSPANLHNEDEIFKVLSKQIDLYEVFNMELTEKRKNMKEICLRISLFGKDLLRLRKKKRKIGGESMMARSFLSRKTLEALENKLEVQTKQFCTICCENDGLRAEILQLLVERREFNKIWTKLLKDLSRGKLILMDLMQQATRTFDEREALLNTLKNLRQHSKATFYKDKINLKITYEKINHYKQLSVFVATKQQKRILRDLMIKAEEKFYRKKEETSCSLEAIQNLLKEIQKFCQKDNLEEIAEDFLDNQENNFLFVTFVNNLKLQLQELKDNLNNNQNKIDKSKLLNKSRNVQQKNSLKNLQKSLDLAKTMTENSTSKLKELESTLKNYLTGIQRLLGLIFAQKSPLKSLLGTKELNFDYVQIFLEAITDEITQLLLKQAHVQLKDLKTTSFSASSQSTGKDKTRDYFKVFSLEEMVSATPCPLCIEHDFVSDVVDALHWPLSKDDIQRALPDNSDRIHKVTSCFLPKAREIIQKQFS